MARRFVLVELDPDVVMPTDELNQHCVMTVGTQKNAYGATVRSIQATSKSITGPPDRIDPIRP